MRRPAFVSKSALPSDVSPYCDDVVFVWDLLRSQMFVFVLDANAGYYIQNHPKQKQTSGLALMLLLALPPVWDPPTLHQLGIL